MGQAKLRGTREERIAHAMALKAEKIKKKKEENLKLLESLTPEERKKRSLRTLESMALVATAIGLSGKFMK